MFSRVTRKISKTEPIDRSVSAARNSVSAQPPRLRSVKRNHTVGSTGRHTLQPAQREDQLLMQTRLRSALCQNSRHTNAYTVNAFKNDLIHVFSCLGLDAQRSGELSTKIIEALQQDKPLVVIEREIYLYLKSLIIDHQVNRNLIDTIHMKLVGRAEKIFGQIRSHLESQRDKRILDFGAGDGQVTQLIHGAISRNTVGIDVRAYGTGSVPVLPYDGRTIPFDTASFDCLVSTNVLHHADDNLRCVKEFSRVLKPGGMGIIIETVPFGKTEEEAQKNWELTFLNDYFYNRLLHDPEEADVPVPGTFKTLPGWVDCFEANHFSVLAVEELGYDQDLIRDYHGLLVVKNNL